MLQPDDPRVPERHRDIWRVLSGVYPEGLVNAEYEALLRVLLEDGMSYRSVVAVIGYFEGHDPGLVYNDVLRADSQRRRGEADAIVEDVRARLEKAGLR